jgi:hypothetical protein
MQPSFVESFLGTNRCSRSFRREPVPSRINGDDTDRGINAGKTVTLSRTVFGGVGSQFRGSTKSLKFHEKAPISGVKEEHMTITPFQVQKVLRTYGRQLSRNRRFLQHQSRLQPPAPDSVNISEKARRLHVVHSVAADIVRNMGQPGGTDSVAGEALDRLSREVGETLEVSADADGGMRFAVIDPETRVIQRHLSQDESKDLQSRLSRIIMDVVNRTMIGYQEMQ